MADNLAGKLLDFNGKLTRPEQANFKLLLGLAAGGLSPGFTPAQEGTRAAAFGAVGRTLAQLQPYSGRIPPNGIAYRGRPTVFRDVLAALQAEARQLRPTARRFEEHYLGRGAPLANRLALSPELTELVCKHAGDVEPTGVASFLFYDEPGQGIDPHIDTDIFAVNVLLMLDHIVSPAAISRSALVIFPPYKEPLRVELQPGETIIMFAGSITHGREHMQPGEAVSIVTFGFQPRDA